VVVFDEEIGDAMTIETISWQRGPAGSSDASFNGFEIYMGLCASDMLGTTFDDNYIPGSRTLVYKTPYLEVSANPDEWIDITLDTPYWYNGVDNLLIEVLWNSGSGTVYAYIWNTSGTTPRSVKSAVSSSPDGFLSPSLSELMLDGPSALDQTTFGAIKALFAE